MEARDSNLIPGLRRAWGIFRGGGRKPVTRERVASRGAMVAGVGIGAAALYWALRAPKKPKRPRNRLPTQARGKPLCPTEVPGSSPPDLTGLKKGDFVIVTLSNETGNLRESTWGEVLNVSGQKIAVELVATQRGKFGGPRTEVVPESLKSEWHGFHTGQKLFLSPDCIWDVLHVHPQPGTMVCAQKGEIVIGRPPLSERFLAGGFRVQVILGSPGGSALESVWATVERISPTGSVITARIDEPPRHSKIHGFALGDTIEFARDCIFGVEAA